MLRTALRFIRYDKAKSIGVTIGIVISTFLIGQQVGIFTFLTGLMSGLTDHTDSEVWIVDKKAINANALGQLDTRVIAEARSIVGVKHAEPMVIAPAMATFADGTTATVEVIGSEAPTFGAGPKLSDIIEGKRENLMEEATVSGDYFDRNLFGGSAAVGTEFEINGRRAVFGVQTKNARGFAGSFMFSTAERARYYAGLPANTINAVLIYVTPGEKPEAVRDRINATIPNCRAWLRKDLSASTINDTLSNSGIGISTGTLILFALISGFFIIGLTMYSSALDRIRDYGTLKAIGASNGYVRGLILTQAVIFAIVGFAIAFAFLEGFRTGSEGSGLVFFFPWYIVAGIFGVTVLISVGGAVFALRRITQLEPAAVFRA
ncbi:MAG: FtsX-like permease family protein [Bacteroidetes bacterium]|nr:FtsX-like permease family protein [Bacteroidota bacterium]MBL0016744.1 FtsX-like permease family protein [Bacteroidota bacterium]